MQESKLEKITKENDVKRAFYKYSVDVTSGWLYYTTTYAAQEILTTYLKNGEITEANIDSIIKTRMLGMLTHAVVMRPIGRLRNNIAQKYNVDEDSRFIDKLKVNFLSVTPIQSIAYGAMIAGATALTQDKDWEKGALLWLIGIGVGAFHAFPYGLFQDKFRGFFGIKPAIKKSI